MYAGAGWLCPADETTAVAGPATSRNGGGVGKAEVLSGHAGAGKYEEGTLYLGERQWLMPRGVSHGPSGTLKPSPNRRDRRPKIVSAKGKDANPLESMPTRSLSGLIMIFPPAEANRSRPWTGSRVAARGLLAVGQWWG